jgi:hypothetical protein
MRASRANLVVLLEGTDRGASGESLLDDLLPTIASIFPARLLVVRLGALAEPGALRGSVSALCTLGGGARYLCCEKIEIDAGAGAEPSIPGSVFSLLLGELPVVTWVPGEVPHAEAWFRLLLASSDRLLIDSSRFSAPSASFLALARITGSFERVRLADFEWARLTPWRRAIASAFDPPAAREAALQGFERVTFVESRAAGRARPVQGVLADEAPAEAVASAPSFLLKAWMGRHARVHSFAWDLFGDRSAPPSIPGAGDAGRGIRLIRFEGRAAGSPFTIEVPAPTNGEPDHADYVMMIGGQPDNPMLPE